MLQRAHYCGAHRNHAATIFQSLVDGARSICYDLVALDVKFVGLDCLLAQRLKCSQSDMKGHLDDLHAARADAVENVGRKMQACGGRGGRADWLREDSLIAYAIRSPIVALNVGWQGNVPDFLEPMEEIRRWREAQAALAELPAGDDLSFEQRLPELVLSESQDLADPELAPWPHQRLPFIAALLSGEQHLDSPAQELACRRIMRAQWLGAPAGAMAEQSRREDPAVVEDEHVARFQALGKISEVFVVKLSAVPIQDQHAG